ncbi:MAG: hypothetical protein Q4A82_01490 [Corynebacterium sp.]|nr:hypothetical protein [Corynebacterium sp.]
MTQLDDDNNNSVLPPLENLFGDVALAPPELDSMLDVAFDLNTLDPGVDIPNDDIDLGELDDSTGTIDEDLSLITHDDGDHDLDHPDDHPDLEDDLDTHDVFNTHAGDPNQYDDHNSDVSLDHGGLFDEAYNDGDDLLGGLT